MATEIDDAEIVNQVVEKLVIKFPDVRPVEVERVVFAEFATYADAPVRDYLGVLTERRAKGRLQAFHAA